MKPTVYLYQESDDKFELYVGELSTSECIANFNSESIININEFGATLYKNYGWATESELPEIETIKDLLTLLNSEGDIGLIEFEAHIENIGTINSHDDCECNIRFNKKHDCIEFIKKITSNQYQNLIINTLVENKGLYISCDENGNIYKYHTFDEYVNKNA